MTKIVEKENSVKERNFFDYFTEVIGWIEIVVSPFLLTGIIGFLIYVANPNTTRLIIAIGITFAGLTAGIVFATKIWKKRGTINFVSRISASPELDNIEEE